MGDERTGVVRRPELARTPRIAIQIAAVALATVGAWVLAHHLVRPLWHGFLDLRVYRGAIQWWASGHPLYSFGATAYAFTYPPFAALGLSPLALGGWRLQAVLLSAASIAVIVTTTWVFLAPVARRIGWPPVFTVGLAVPVVLLMDPVRETLAFGQINLLLVALVLADALAIRRGWRWAGVGTGIAAAIKLTPAIFIVYFALSRRRRPAAVAVGTFAAATVGAFVVSPATSIDYWTSRLWDTAHVGHIDKTSDQSLLGLLTRLFDGAPPRLLWLLLVVAVAVLGLTRAVRAAAAGDELVGLVLAGLTGALVSPISWTHHLYWLVPAVIVLVDVAAGRTVHRLLSRARPKGWTVRIPAGLAAVGITLAGCSSVIWYFQRDEGRTHATGLLGVVGENAFVLVMLGLVALLPAREEVLDGGGDR